MGGGIKSTATKVLSGYAITSLTGNNMLGAVGGFLIGGVPGAAGGFLAPQINGIVPKMGGAISGGTV